VKESVTRALVGFLLGLAFLALASLSSKAQTPQPGSIQKIQYSPGKCRHDGEITRCKWALVTFGAISGRPAGPLQDGPPVSTFVAPQHPDADRIEFHYTPTECKPVPNDPRFVCKDVWWQPAKKGKS